MTKITDDAVERARSTLMFHLNEHCGPEQMRAALNAAFNDRTDAELAHMLATAGPGQIHRVSAGEMERLRNGLFQVPEITVTNEMINAGIAASNKKGDSFSEEAFEKKMAAIFRAMRKLEPSKVTCIKSPSGWRHHRVADGGTTIGDMNQHRRWSDPA